MYRTIIGVLCTTWLAGAAAAVLAADKEKPRYPAGGGETPSKPADPPPAKSGELVEAEETPDGKRRLAGGQVEFVPPPKEDWVESTKNRTATRNAFVSRDRKAMMVVEVVPPDQKYGPEAAPVIIKKLKQNRAASKEVPTQEPAVERDAQYALRIREKFTASDGVAGEQLHLYRAVGPRYVYVLCKTFGTEETAPGHLKAAEAASLSAAPAGGEQKPAKPAKSEPPGRSEKPTKSEAPGKSEKPAKR